PLHGLLAKSDQVERLADRLGFTLGTQNFLGSPEDFGVEQTFFLTSLAIHTPLSDVYFEQIYVYSDQRSSCYTRLHRQGRCRAPAPGRSCQTRHAGGFWGMSSTSFVLE